MLEIHNERNKISQKINSLVQQTELWECFFSVPYTTCTSHSYIKFMRMHTTDLPFIIAVDSESFSESIQICLFVCPPCIFYVRHFGEISYTDIFWANTKRYWKWFESDHCFEHFPSAAIFWKVVKRYAKCCRLFYDGLWSLIKFSLVITWKINNNATKFGDDSTIMQSLLRFSCPLSNFAAIITFHQASYTFFTSLYKYIHAYKRHGFQI